MARYIDAEKLKDRIKASCVFPNIGQDGYFLQDCTVDLIDKQPTADVEEVVRCKDCKHFQPCFVMTADGERRPYTEEEINNGKMVTGDIGINCGSRCERFGYWEENKIPVWFSENDYCSYGERKEK